VPEPLPDPRKEPVASARVYVTTASILLTIAAVVVAIAARAVFMAAHRVIGWVIACVIVTVLIDPIVGFLSRYVKRAFAIILVLLGIVAVAGGLLTGTYENLRRQVDTLKEAAPDAAGRLEQSQRFGKIARDLKIHERVTTFVDALDKRVGSGATVVRSAVGTVPTYAVCGILVIFFLLYGPRIVKSGFGLVQDDAKRVRWERQTNQAVARARGYVLLALAQAMVVGLIAYTALRIAEVPVALVLAVIVGAFSVIPYFGILLGALPALLVAAGLRSTTAALYLLLAFFALQAIEAFEVRRRVDARTLRVGPAAVVLSLLMGYAIYGIGGAVYGGAIAVFAMALADATATAGAPVPPTMRR
jgi:putative heme transporter